MEKEEIFLDAATILRFLLELDDNLDTLILCKPGHIRLIATDQGIYEAIASVKKRSSINYNKLVKFFEVVEILPYSIYFNRPRKIITDEVAEELRKKAKKEVHKSRKR